MFFSEFLCHISWCLMTEDSEAGSHFACTIVSKLAQNSLVYEEQKDTVNFLFFFFLLSSMKGSVFLV